MSRFKAGLGVAVLSALCVCAIGASNASALTAHECLSGAGKGTGTEYTSSTCTTPGAGGFFTVPLAAGKHAVNVTSGGTSTLAATVGGVKFKISCTGESGTAELENVETTGGIMQVLGSKIIVNYEGCTVVEPAGKGCTVPSKITTNSLKSKTEEMKSIFTPELKEGKEQPFVTISVTGCSSSALNGEKEVTGSATSVTEAGTPTVQEFTATSGSALKFGGQAATFLSKNGQATSNGTAIALETP